MILLGKFEPGYAEEVARHVPTHPEDFKGGGVEIHGLRAHKR
jgi:hypothetical protein